MTTGNINSFCVVKGSNLPILRNSFDKETPAINCKLHPYVDKGVVCRQGRLPPPSWNTWSLRELHMFCMCKSILFQNLSWFFSGLSTWNIHWFVVLYYAWELFKHWIAFGPRCSRAIWIALDRIANKMHRVSGAWKFAILSYAIYMARDPRKNAIQYLYLHLFTNFVAILLTLTRNVISLRFQTYKKYT